MIPCLVCIYNVLISTETKRDMWAELQTVAQWASVIIPSPATVLSPTVLSDGKVCHVMSMFSHSEKKRFLRGSMDGEQLCTPKGVLLWSKCVKLEEHLLTVMDGWMYLHLTPNVTRTDFSSTKMLWENLLKANVLGPEKNKHWRKANERKKTCASTFEELLFFWIIW